MALGRRWFAAVRVGYATQILRFGLLALAAVTVAAVGIVVLIQNGRGPVTRLEDARGG